MGEADPKAALDRIENEAHSLQLAVTALAEERGIVSFGPFSLRALSQRCSASPLDYRNSTRAELARRPELLTMISAFRTPIRASRHAGVRLVPKGNSQ
jgi:hypothetical protein